MVPSPHALLQLEEPSRQVGSDPLLKTKDYGHRLSLFGSDTNCLASDLTTDHMETEQDSLSTSRNDEPGSCSKPFDHEDNWLQLGLAGRLVPPQEPELARPRNLVELDLLPAKTTGTTTPPSAHIPGYPVHPPPLFLHPHGTAGFGFRQPEYFWNFRQMAYSSNTWNVQYSLPGNGVAAAKPGPSSSLMKIVNAPPRPNSGLWFVLQAEQNQIKELALPQVQKSYLRIKDRKMTILLIMKYLANKLHLGSESEHNKTRKQSICGLVHI
ncbi:E3 ubiquitin protein ligase [Nymphaea thermarum]|nr:E3 ubiquitin protein ligase [Nymphaea thermarum]